MEPLSTTIPLMLCCAVATISNCFVCYLILTVRRLKTTTNVFVFSLCVCDILFAAVLLPVHCFYQNSFVYLYLVIISVLVYIANLTAATYERLYSITKPLRYHMVMTKRKALLIVIIAWCAPLFYCFLPFIWGNNQSTLIHKGYMIGTLVLFLLGPLFFIVFVYIKVCLEIKKLYDYKKTLMVANQDNNNNLDTGDARLLCSLLCCTDQIRSRSRSMRGNSFLANNSEDAANTVVFYDDKLHKSRTTVDRNPNKLSCNTILKKTASMRSVHSISSKKLFGQHIFKALIPTQHRSAIRRKSSLGKIRDTMQELKASFAFGVVTMTYMFTWLPVVVMTFLQVLEKHSLIPQNLVIFSIFSIALNAFSDPFLYALLLENFRKTLRKMFCRIKHSRPIY